MEYHPDTSATSILFTDLFRRVAARGYRVTILTGFPSKDGGDVLRALPRRELADGVEIVRCGARLQSKANMRSRGLSYAAFILHAVLALPRYRDASVIAATNPPFTPVAMWLASCAFGIRFGQLLLDLYPDGLIEMGLLSPRSWTARFWAELNRRAFRRASWVAVIGRDMEARVTARYCLPTNQLSYLPHWATEDLDRCRPVSSRAMLERLGLAGKFVMQYSGNMGLWHDIDTIVRAAALVRDDPSIHFLFIGKGMRLRSAKALARQLGCANVTWVDFLPREQLPESLTNCDAALISLRPGLQGVAVPSKLYGILAAGRPVVAQVPRDSEVALAVDEADCGFVVEPGNPAELANAVRRLAADRRLASCMGDRARRAYDQKYTIDIATDTIERLLRLS